MKSMDAKVEKSRKDLLTYFLFGGIVLLIFGGFQLFTFFKSGECISLYDACFNCLAGILSLAGARLVSKGKFLVLLVVFFYIIAGILYAFAVGRGFNYFIFLFAVILFPWMYFLRKNGALV
jgi:uncharacterized membrane protein HdeD (DUF308 family)